MANFNKKFDSIRQDMNIAKLKTGKDGYVKLFRCDKGHAGNTRYVRDGAYCQCQGCGYVLSVEFCISEQQKLAEAASKQKGECKI